MTRAATAVTLTISGILLVAGIVFELVSPANADSEAAATNAVLRLVAAASFFSVVTLVAAALQWRELAGRSLALAGFAVVSPGLIVVVMDVLTR